MRPSLKIDDIFDKPQLLPKANQLALYLKTLSAKELAEVMKITPKLADTTKTLIQSWSDVINYQRPAVDSFLGDIYSGLQVGSWTADDRNYANDHLRILSGLYGILRPLDGICPYRLEMGYKLPDDKYKNLYKFWGHRIADTLPEDQQIINLAAVEYSKTVTQYVDESKIITPSFLTVNSKTDQPTFVTVHAKVARGAFAKWLIVNKIIDPEKIKDFDSIGYSYDKQLSKNRFPVFVCQEFGGKGLSVRLT
jgi:cytoplasmic iron level regulating protein YaaA (DUF328/UPF0246 family)